MADPAASLSKICPVSVVHATDPEQAWLVVSSRVPLHARGFGFFPDCKSCAVNSAWARRVLSSARVMKRSLS
eukprot:2625615-Heterocapsa_arctica.AAC.1